MGFRRPTGTEGAVVIAVVVIAVMSLSRRLSNLGWIFDVLAPFPFHLLLASGVAALVASARRRSFIAAVAAAVALLNAWAIWAPQPRPAPAAAGPRLVIEHLNTNGDVTVSRAVRYLDATDADAVVLLHVSSAWVDGLRSRLAGLRPRLAGLHIVAFDPGIAHDGALVLARDPSAVGEVVSPDGRVGVAVDVPLGRGRVTVLGIHPVSPLTPGRGRTRDSELRWIGRWAKERAAPTAVVGDFNATRWSASFRDMLRTGAMVNSRPHGWAPTFPRWLGLLGIPIDQAVHTRDLTTVERTTASGLGSGHRRLRVVLAWRG